MIKVVVLHRQGGHYFMSAFPNSTGRFSKDCLFFDENHRMHKADFDRIAIAGLLRTSESFEEQEASDRQAQLRTSRARLDKEALRQ